VAFENVGKKATDKALRTAAKAMAYEDTDELLSLLGSADITALDVVRAIYPNLAAKGGDEVDAGRAVVGLNADQMHQRAQCCQPVPGERIVGITFRGEGVVIHAIDCGALADYEEQAERWIDLRWHEGTHGAINNVTIDATITNDAGVLGRICTLIGEQEANISDLNFIERKPDYYRLMLDIELRDAEHLHRVMTALEAESNVSSIGRHRDPGLASIGQTKH
jgi:GTP pyrophosphokinase